MSIKHILNEEIESEISELRKMDIGSDEYETAANGVSKLLDKAIELEKLEVESKEKVNSRNAEVELKLQQMEDERKDRFVKNCITVGTFIGGVAVYGVAFVASMNFEKEGTLTTEGGRSALRSLLKLK